MQVNSVHNCYVHRNIGSTALIFICSTPASMAKDNARAAAPLPATPTPALKKSTSNTQNMKNQKTLLGFFQKTPSTASSTSTVPEPLSVVARKKPMLQKKSVLRHSGTHITPTPSSDALDEDDNTAECNVSKESSRSKRGLPSPVSSANGELGGQTVADAEELTTFGTPSRKVRYPTSPSFRDKLT
jgi:DNA mismatch repair protein MSH6